MECIACGQQTHSPLVRGGALLCATCREAGDTADLRDRIAELEAEVKRLRELTRMDLDDAQEWVQAVAKVTVQRDRLAEALRPFVKRETYWRNRMRSSSPHLPVRTERLVVTDDELEAACAAMAELEGE